MSKQAQIQKNQIFKKSRAVQILRYVHENPEISWRELSPRLGVSLRANNYGLKVLMDRGLVKIQDFNKNPNKVGYPFFLTPTGITEKLYYPRDFSKEKLEKEKSLNMMRSKKSVGSRRNLITPREKMLKWRGLK